MIEKSIIYATLIGIVITGVIPVIGGIILLVTGKLKGSSFWAGVLAYIIAIIVSSIISSMMSMPMIMQSGGIPAQEDTAKIGVISSIVSAVCFALSIGICIKSCMKKTRSFKGGISCGLGFAAGYAVTTAIGLVSIYAIFGMINSGTFDAQYTALIEQGFLSKEDFAAMKAVYTDYNVPAIALETASALGLSLAAAASGAFIMRFVCAKKTFLGILLSAIVILLGSISSIIPNVIAASVISLAIGAAAMIFAFRMKDSTAAEEVPAVKDDFLNSVENAKNSEDPYNM